MAISDNDPLRKIGPGEAMLNARKAGITGDDPLSKAKRGLYALYTQVPDAVAHDVAQLVEAAFTDIESRVREQIAQQIESMSSPYAGGPFKVRADAAKLAREGMPT